MKYIERLSDIIQSPDYIGVNPKEQGKSIELIKVLDDNVLVGVKFDKSRDYLYVASIYDIQSSKVERRLYSGRLKIYEKDIDK
ncbi:PBECR2 nuclease fold domain-containing protein [Bengtsoniella intestinalis]|uniref:PBECR3 domain-containing polyvalent protein n=1 Tax=Bengtsoniella intestinalis TaxID=3073143 RepID=UPI00391F489C